MSDTRLRELERGDDAGDFAARVRLIAERLRVGAITPEQVRLAAFVGDPAARLVAGNTAPPEVHALEQWWIEIASHGPQAASRSFCATAALADAPGNQFILRRVMDWCVCPCDVHAHIAQNTRFEGHDGSPDWVLSADLIGKAAHALVDLRRSGRLRDRVSRSPRSNRACGFPAHG